MGRENLVNLCKLLCVWLFGFRLIVTMCLGYFAYMTQTKTMLMGFFTMLLYYFLGFMQTIYVLLCVSIYAGILYKEHIMMAQHFTQGLVLQQVHEYKNYMSANKNTTNSILMKIG